MDHHQVYRHSTNCINLQSNINFAAYRSSQWVGLFVVWILAAVLTLHAGNASEPLREEKLTIASGGKTYQISVEVAETERQKAIGLMFRKFLSPDKGMLFPYPQPQELTMWMRNTYIPLDMLFIKADGTIHRIAQNTEPFSEEVVASKGDVTAVLELAGGVTKSLGIKPGDKVVHRHFAGK